MDAPVIVTYGAPGTGKTSDAVALGAADWGFVGPPGGLRVGHNVFGVDIPVNRMTTAYNLEQVIGLLKPAKDAGMKGIVVDDASILAGNSLTDAKARFAIVKNGRAAGYDWELWTQIRLLVEQLATHARYVGIPVLLTAHLCESWTDSKTGMFHKGGPDFGWKKLTEEPIYVCDLVQRSEPDPYAKPWDTRVHCDERDPQWAQKNRFDNLPRAKAPLNTAEVLRDAGWPVARPEPLASAEAFVEGLAEAFLGGLSEEDGVKQAKEKLSSTRLDPRHGQWLIRDGVHRARIRAYRKGHWARI